MSNQPVSVVYHSYFKQHNSLIRKRVKCELLSYINRTGKPKLSILIHYSLHLQKIGTIIIAKLASPFNWALRTTTHNKSLRRQHKVFHVTGPGLAQELQHLTGVNSADSTTG